MLIALNRKWRLHSSSFRKLIRIMKLTFILLTVVALQVSARGYTQSITLTLKNAPLEKVFESITHQSGYRFFYNEEQFLFASEIKALVSCIDNRRRWSSRSSNGIRMSSDRTSPASMKMVESETFQMAIGPKNAIISFRTVVLSWLSV